MLWPRNRGATPRRAEIIPPRSGRPKGDDGGATWSGTALALHRGTHRCPTPCQTTSQSGFRSGSAIGTERTAPARSGRLAPATRHCERSEAIQRSTPHPGLLATLATTALALNPVSRRFKRIIERFPLDRRLRLAACGIHAAHGQITPIATVRDRRHSSEVAAALGQSTRHIRRRDVPSQATTVAVSPGTSIVIEPSSSASSRRIPARCPAVQRLASVGPEKSSALPATSSRCSA